MIGEDAVIHTPKDLLLRMVQRQGTQVIGFNGIHLDLDVARHLAALHHTIGILEEDFWREISRYFKCCRLSLNFEDSVQGIGADGLSHGAVCNHIPALLEKFDTIGMDIGDNRLFMPKTLISQSDDVVALHRVKDIRQISQTRGHVLEQDTVLERDVVHQQLAHTDGIDEPVAQVTTLQDFGISDVITITTLALALDFNMKLLPNGFAPLVEGAIKEINAITQVLVVLAHPLLLDTFQSNARIASLANGIHEPNVLVDNLCHSLLLIFPSTKIAKTYESKGHMLRKNEKKSYFFRCI